ncbi:NAD(P)-binding domain-containing protein [Neorhodopirellula pilleata]|uniref:Ferredoxin--NADP reductase n=1 Tax=Neorhodopirellula pilleata TaxID=2714738 RepID=A0A5C5ZX26_9BACT|nr:NAD(P)-binding domain-containing protein [Neorhodopirellula pilleata]TWT92182.1 Ferredoxin--NADP reductase [Neorhodopirellula pilleata]
MDNGLVDAVVIGGGPIGIETSIELRRRGIESLVCEAGALGHTIAWWAPQTRWFSSNDRIAIAGVPLHTVDQSKASREEYLNYLRSVVDQFHVPVKTFTKVQSLVPVDQSDEPKWRLAFAGQTNSLETKAVILAIGGTDFPNRLNVPGESLPHVDGYLREVHRYHGRRVLIVGGRNSAVEAAIRLHRSGARVMLSYHGESLPTDGIKYWLRPEIDGLIRSGSVPAWFHSRVIRIDSDAVHLQVQTPAGEEEVRVEADDVLTLIGYRQNQTLFQELGILSDELEPKPIFDPETMQTPRPGIYVAGTAVGGTQSSKYQVFLENCHDHSTKIADHLQRRFDSRRSTVESLSLHRQTESLDNLRQRIGLQPES